LLIKNNIAVPPPKKRRKLESDATLDDYSAHLITATEDAAALEEVYVFMPNISRTLLSMDISSVFTHTCFKRYQNGPQKSRLWPRQRSCLRIAGHFQEEINP
jgi:hypothetical protein